MFMPFELTNKILTYYEFYGDTQTKNEIIVMIHGWGLDSTVWGDLIQLLEKRYVVIVYDIRSHGKSSVSKDEITWEQLCEDLQQLMKQLDIHQFHLLAFGYGTYLATKFTLGYPTYVQSLILLSLPYMSVNNTHYHLSKHVFPAIQETMESGNKYYLRRYKDLLKGYTTLDADSPQLLHYFQVLLGRPMVQISKMINLATNTNLLLELPHIQCPVMIVTGELNVTSPSELFNASSILLNNSTLIKIPNASFLLFLEQPNELAKWIHIFISQKCSNLLNQRKNKGEINQLIQTIFQPVVPTFQRRNHVLNIYLINTFHVEIDSIPITTGWNQRHAKRLLMYLVFHPVTTREIICEELFPYFDTDKALANLKVYLNHLDKLLIHTNSSSRGLLFNKGAVTLQYKIKCDLIDLMETLRQAYHEKESTIRYQLCEKILDISPVNLLTDIYDDWAIQMKNQIEMQFYELNEWMAVYCANQYNYSKALYYYMNMLHYRPDDEDIYDSIIEMMNRSGNDRKKEEWKQKKATLF